MTLSTSHKPCWCSPEPDPLCSERGTPESECPAYCLHGLSTPPAQRVHNHPPYRPVCNERQVDGRLRGACLNDDGSDR